jgi:hypothetical protein
VDCPHCTKSIFIGTVQRHEVGEDRERQWSVESYKCPNCRRLVISLRDAPLLSQIISSKQAGAPAGDKTRPPASRLVHPRSVGRAPLGVEVPARFAADYVEAAAVLGESPKASAAISRRLLQDILRDVAKVKAKDLNGEIDAVIASGKLPSELAEDLDAIRQVGNFAAHPMKSTSTGEVVPVEPGEAEWLLEVLDGLFDFYFTQPATRAERRARLNEKLKDAGKPPLKDSSNDD